MLAALLLGVAVATAEVKVNVVQTALFKDGTTHLLEEMPPIEFKKMDKPDSKSLNVDSSQLFQEIVGFGGAFTEASAINWRSLSPEDQEKVIQLYFASPEEGGHGYTLGRVPINSCDFSPGSYNFDNVSGDMELENFDMSVKHDVDVGMVPMMQEAQKMLAKSGRKLQMFASPWSMPYWMKLSDPVSGKQAMTASASPNGLDPDMQRPWAKYYSKFITAYKQLGIDMWGVTVQNEPEAAVGWEACLWTPEFTAAFVKDHLGPVLHEEQPGVKIIGFDHNKDHVFAWAKVLYADPDAAKYFDGIGVHWYGGLNVHNLQSTHNLAPDKFILPTEACNCGGVVYKWTDMKVWWARAEAIALDILEDLRFWAVGWTDWNLVLSTIGGPNHLKNMCDANIIADPTHSLKQGTLIMQASYYFMGHFSRYIPTGSKKVFLEHNVETHAPELTPSDVKNGQALIFDSCKGNAVQAWSFRDDQLVIVDTDNTKGSDGFKHGGECADAALDGPVPKIQTWGCAHSGNQIWKLNSVPGGKQIVNTWSGKCITAVQTTGAAVGLDQGVKVTAAQYADCLADGDPSQTFILANYDGGGFPDNFPVRSASGLCMGPQITLVPHFDAVAFKTPDDTISLVTMNTGEAPLDFAIYDERLGVGLETVKLPPHSIQTYRWKAAKSSGPTPSLTTDPSNDAAIAADDASLVLAPASSAELRAVSESEAKAEPKFDTKPESETAVKTEAGPATETEVKAEAEPKTFAQPRTVTVVMPSRPEQPAAAAFPRRPAEASEPSVAANGPQRLEASAIHSEAAAAPAASSSVFAMAMMLMLFFPAAVYVGYLRAGRPPATYEQQLGNMDADDSAYHEFGEAVSELRAAVEEMESNQHVRAAMAA